MSNQEEVEKMRELIEQAAEQYYGAPLGDDYFDIHPDILGWFQQFILLKSEAPKHPQAEAVEQEPVGYINVTPRERFVSFHTYDHNIKFKNGTDLYLHPQSPKASNAMNGWQPIDTAPKDGTDIIALFVGSDVQIIVCYDDSNLVNPNNPWCTLDGLAYHKEAFTHWQLLPEPPVQEAK